jgi:hypothetical protein
MKARLAAVASLAFLLTLSTAHVQSSKKGFIYQPGTAAFWDPSIIYNAGKYFLFAMYGGDSIWLATSTRSAFGVLLLQRERTRRIYFAEKRSHILEALVLRDEPVSRGETCAHPVHTSQPVQIALTRPDRQDMLTRI